MGCMAATFGDKKNNANEPPREGVTREMETQQSG